MRILYEDYNAMEDALGVSMFLCIESIIDYKNTVDISKPVLLDQAIDLLTEACVKQQDYRLILLIDNQKARNKNDVIFPINKQFVSYIVSELRKHNISVLAVYSVGYRRPTMTPGDDEYEYEFSSIAAVITNFEHLCDFCCPDHVFIGHGASRMAFIPKRINDEYGYNLEYYPYLYDFEQRLLKNNPTYIHKIERTRTVEQKKSSKGESAIRRWLTNQGISFKEQYIFDDCRDIRSLPFDFAITTNDTIKCIEYDGAQHNEAVDYFGGQERFEYVKRHDKIKSEYCANNNIPLLRITDADVIEKCLTTFLLNQRKGDIKKK